SVTKAAGVPTITDISSGLAGCSGATPSNPCYIVNFLHALIGMVISSTTSTAGCIAHGPCVFEQSVLYHQGIHPGTGAFVVATNGYLLGQSAGVFPIV